jgi:hypothetical protein
MSEIVKITIEELLDNLDQYYGKVVEVTGIVFTVYRVCFLREHNTPKWKVRVDDRSILISIEYTNLKFLLGWVDGGKFFRHVGDIERFNCTLRGRVDKLELRPLSAIIRDITYVSTVEHYHSSDTLKNLDYKSDRADGYIHESQILQGNFYDDFKKKWFSTKANYELTIPIADDVSESINLNLYHGHIESLIGSVVTMKCLIYQFFHPSPDLMTKWQFGISLETLIDIEASSPWIWIKIRDYFHIYLSAFVSRTAYLGGPSQPFEATIVGQLKYIREDDNIPPRVPQTNLMLDNLQVIVIEETHLLDYYWG